VDERSTATALGYVAMVVQILGNLGGTGGGLAYPVTCAGSRSLVKDVVSVMQGPRSFPLYAKGVERYRYEYAVFLLNKNIEMLMQEANIRLLDLRHTLPNLKALLLTLSSPVPPPQLRSGSTTYVNSRTSSRQTSHAWSVTIPRGLASPTSSAGRDSPSSTRLGGGSAGTPSPLKVVGRRSRLSRAGSGITGEAREESDEEDEEELEKSEVGTEGSVERSLVTSP